MPEFFISANSFAAPFVSDQSTHYMEARTAEDALTAFAAEYRHPAGLYAADAYASADAYHKGEKRLARWLSNKAAALENQEGPKLIYSASPGHLEINGENVAVADPKGGRIVG